jgi:hypothetical protein
LTIQRWAMMIMVFRFVANIYFVGSHLISFSHPLYLPSQVEVAANQTGLQHI